MKKNIPNRISIITTTAITIQINEKSSHIMPIKAPDHKQAETARNLHKLSNHKQVKTIKTIEAISKAIG